MLRRTLTAISFVSSLALLACEGGGGTGGSGAGGTGEGLPCDVDAILAQHCRSCHAEKTMFGAPMSLVTHADVIATSTKDSSKKIYERMGVRTHDDAHPMPPPPNARLNKSEQATLDAWIAAGAPAGTGGACQDGGAGGADGGSIGCTPNVSLAPASAFTMPQSVDDMYVCYGFDVIKNQKEHVTAFVPRVDNGGILHHIVLFESPTSVSATPYPCALSGAQTWKIVSVWAPGGEGFELPPEAGLPIEGTAHYVVQLHYNNLKHLAGQTDASGFDLCTTPDLRPNDADILAFGTFQLSIPAHGSLDLTCDLTIPVGLPTTHVIGAMPHMHKLGKSISTVNKPSGGGAPIDLGTRSPWDFATQYWSRLDETIVPGDVISTRCVWENDTDKDVHWGENTEDEMCFSFTAYYPKINVPNWSWGVPSVASQCSPTP